MNPVGYNSSYQQSPYEGWHSATDQVTGRTYYTNGTDSSWTWPPQNNATQASSSQQPAYQQVPMQQQQAYSQNTSLNAAAKNPSIVAYRPDSRNQVVDLHSNSTTWLLTHSNPLAADFFFKGVFDLTASSKQPVPNRVIASCNFKSGRHRYDAVAILETRPDGKHELLEVRIKPQFSAEPPQVILPK